MRWIKIFFIFYAAAFITVALTRVKPWISLQPEIPPLVPGTYLVLLAIIWVVSREERGFPSGIWVKISYGLALIWGGVELYPDIKGLVSKNGGAFSDLVATLVLIAWILASVWVAQLLLHRFSREGKNGRGWIERSGAALLLGLGAFCVLATLSLTITPEGSGWHVLIGNASWVTQTYNVFGYSSAAEKYQWLAAIFGRTGRALYACGLISALLVLLMLGRAKFSVDRVRGSKLLLPIIATNVLYTMYLLHDFYWGAYGGTNTKLWAASLGALCWLGAIGFSGWAARLIANGSVQLWHVQAMVCLQLPFVAVLFFLFADMILIESLGLILLVIGALLQNFGCMILLARKAEEITVLARTADCSI